MGEEPAARLALIGCGWIGRFHAETIALRIPDATLAAVADPVPGAATSVAEQYGAVAFTDAAEVLSLPDVDGVVIASPASTHTDLVVNAAAAGKAVFVEKPMALSLSDADRAIEAADAAQVVLQVGFNRRFDRDFAAAQLQVDSSSIGQPQLMRSLTRDPGLANPGAVPPWTIFNETLIHDFDTLNWFNRGSRPTEVFAWADALVAPEFKGHGLLDTALVSIRYDNGALATAEANFSAAYGYDVRAEVFGSKGMITVGDVRNTSLRQYTAEGQSAATTRLNIDLFNQGYTAELAAFVRAIRTGQRGEGATGRDAKTALSIALACIESVKSNAPVAVSELSRVG